MKLKLLACVRQQNSLPFPVLNCPYLGQPFPIFAKVLYEQPLLILQVYCSMRLQL